jgi:hypothetical protein
MLIKNEEEEFTIWFRYGGIVTFNLRVDDRFWLQHLMHTLGDILNVRVLYIYIGCPYLEFHRNIGREYGRRPFEVKLQLDEYFRELIKNCHALEKLEVNLFHYDAYEYAEEILDNGYLPQIRPQIMAAMGDDVSETLRTTESPVYCGYLNKSSINDMQLLDRRLVYTKKVKE